MDNNMDNAIDNNVDNDVGDCEDYDNDYDYDAEDYVYDKDLQSRIAELESKKRHAIDREDYKEAHRLKMQIAELQEGDEEEEDEEEDYDYNNLEDYDYNNVGGCEDHDTLALVPNHGGEMHAIRTLFRVTDPHNLGKGRDMKSFQPYSDLEVVHAWRITQPMQVYGNKMARACNDMNAMSKAGVSLRPTYTSLDNCGLPALDDAANEHRLLHGVKPEIVSSILQNGFHIDPRSCGGLFGKGVYFAEMPSKVDQYCTSDVGGHHDLNQMLYANSGIPHPGEVFYCFAVRVTVGAALHTQDGEHDMNRGASIWGSGDKHILTAAPGTSPPVHYHTLVVETGEKVLRHREFVIFDADRTSLEYLIAFRRMT